ncbi:MAG: hypothetical protein IJ631_02425, partial [Schwartzia sp.]|nr:hypothetical protein [Schwartzia sp. (in: firmicutes)]
MKTMSKLLLLLSLLLIFPASVSADAPPVFCVAAFASRVPITNLSDEQIEEFHIVDEYLMYELSEANLTLIDVSLDTSRARASEQLTQMERGALPPEIESVHPDYIIYGYLTNLGVALSKRPDSNAYVVRADLSARVIDAATGKQVFTATGTGESSAKSYAVDLVGVKLLRFGTKEFTEECLHEALLK